MTTIRYIDNSTPIAYPYAVLLFKDGSIMPPTIPQSRRHAICQETGPIQFGKIVKMAKQGRRGLGRGKKKIMGVFCLFSGEFQIPLGGRVNTERFTKIIHTWIDKVDSKNK